MRFSTGLLSSAQDDLDPAVLRLPHALRGLHQRTALAKALHVDRGTPSRTSSAATFCARRSDRPWLYWAVPLLSV